jgi:hypothetical protein
LSSGFPYDERLTPLRVSHEEWYQFSSEVAIAAKLTPQEDWAAWTTGITTGTLTLPFLLVFAPTVGYRAGKAVHRKAVQSNVEKKLVGDGDLRTIIRKWNQNVFLQKGFQAWLEMPSEEKKASKKFRMLIVPNDGMDSRPTNIEMGSGQPEIPNMAEAYGDQVQITRPADNIPSIAEAPALSVTGTTSRFIPSTGRWAPATSRKYVGTNPGEIRHEMEA